MTTGDASLPDPMLRPLPDAVVEALARAIFAKPGAVVTTRGATPDAEPLHLRDVESACAHARMRRDQPGASAQWAVYYPDMGGAMTVRRYGNNPVVEGWGLLNVVLHLAGRSPVGSWVSANSEKRARKWEPTIPHLGPIEAWHWPAVAAHERRLKRVLRLAATEAAP
jgi:hypothetical protein